MTNLAFNEFIEQHVKEPKIDWEAKKSEWIGYLSEFYNKIEDILLSYTKAGKLQLYKKQIELDEEYIGRYKVDAIDILLGNAKVSLTPFTLAQIVFDFPFEKI